MSISLSKWPMLPTMAWCFMPAMCSAVMMSLLPVAVTKMSASPTTSSSVRHLVALHGRLQGADRVDLGDDDPGPLAPQRLGAALADVAVAADHGHLAADQHVGGPVDAVDQGVAAAVLVVELGLGHRVVDVDGREQQLAGALHLVEAVHAGGGLLGHAPDGVGDGRPALRVLGQAPGRGARARPQLLGVGGGRGRGRPRPSRTRRPCGPAGWRRRRRRGSWLGPPSLGPAQGLLGAPPVLLEGLALPGEHRHALGVVDGAVGSDGHGGGRVVLGREDVAAGPAHPGARGRSGSR